MVVGCWGWGEEIMLWRSGNVDGFGGMRVMVKEELCDNLSEVRRMCDGSVVGY